MNHCVSSFKLDFRIIWTQWRNRAKVCCLLWHVLCMKHKLLAKCTMCMFHCVPLTSVEHKCATFHALNTHMSRLWHQYLFQMSGICFYDIWGRFCVAKTNITNITSKKRQHKIFVFCQKLVFTFLAGDKNWQNIMMQNFNPKSRRVMSMKKCIDQVVRRRGNEIHFLGTF